VTEVFVDVVLSLDNYIAPEGMTMDHWDEPERWAAKWEALMGWALNHAPAPTSWASACSKAASAVGRRNRRSTPRSTSSPTSGASPGRGGADVIQRYLNLGVVDELSISLVPVLFGGGRRLFEDLREPLPRFRIARVLDGPAAAHARYVRA